MYNKILSFPPLVGVEFLCLVKNKNWGQEKILYRNISCKRKIVPRLVLKSRLI